VARYGGTEQLRNLDRLSTYTRAHKTYSKETELPAIAAAQSQRIIDRFAEYMPRGNERILRRLTNLLQNLMQIKLELLCSKDGYKISYIPPNSPFDPDIMKAKQSNGCAIMIGKMVTTRFRTTLCIHPMLTRLGEGESPRTQDSGEYHEALLESKRLFPETPGQYQDWNKANVFVNGKAIVLIEEISTTEPAISETRGGAFGIEREMEVEMEN
jgi:hypothetical protein